MPMPELDRVDLLAQVINESQQQTETHFVSLSDNFEIIDREFGKLRDRVAATEGRLADTRRRLRALFVAYLILTVAVICVAVALILHF